MSDASKHKMKMSVVVEIEGEKARSRIEVARFAMTMSDESLCNQTTLENAIAGLLTRSVPVWHKEHPEDIGIYFRGAIQGKRLSVCLPEAKETT